MKIQKIRVRNFKSFYDETEIDFSDLHGMWWVTGVIGSGKTTIGEAIIFGLYGSVADKTNKSLLSWGEQHGLVELWCESRGRNLYIRRELNKHGQDPMSVQVDGEEIIFTNKRNAQEQLEKDFLDATRSSMELLCIISFNNFKSLSTLNTKDTKLFLDQVLGFDTLTSYVDAAKEIQSELKSQLVGIRANISAITRQIERMENQITIDGDPVALRVSIDNIKNDITGVQQKLRDTLAPLQERLTTKQQRLTEVRLLGVAKAREIDFIQKGTCPTCGAPIDQSQLELKIAERSNLRTQYNEIDAEIRDLTQLISTETQKVDKYITEQRNAVKSQENELIKLQEQARRQTLDEGQIAELKAEVESYTVEAADIEEQLGAYSSLIDILQVQIRAKVLDSFIPSINQRIREFAGMLSLQYVPEFDSMFKCSIRSAGSRDIPTSSLSTGQLKMVDMVIILAVLGSVISKVQSNVIFLDELFGNLNSEVRIELMAVLRATMPVDSSILIVSHQDLEEDMMDGKIKIRFEEFETDRFKSILNIHRI